MTLAIVAAVARGGVIGRDGALPWRLPQDLARFRELTTGHAVVMGRRTWESLPDRFRPLPGRRNVVVTRNPSWHEDAAERASSLAGALELLAAEERVFVIGGGAIFVEALPLAEELVLTEIDLDVDGDTFFPEWDRDAFEEMSREERVAEDGTPFAFVRYERRGPSARCQLSALAEATTALEGASIPYWLFGGWAVDFYAGAITRAHDDVDLAVRLADLGRIARLLEAGGWRHAPDPDEDGGTGYEREGERLELTFLVEATAGRVVTPLKARDAEWPDGAFGDAVGELHGVRAHLVSLAALAEGKSQPREDLADAAKDRADSETLSNL